VSAAPAASPVPSSQTVLAFDFGEKYLGVAVGDTETRIASPLGMIAASANEKRFAEIDAMIGEWRPGKLVVGLPLHMDGAEHDMSRRARRFARQLEARYRLPVAMEDERLTSAAAEESLRETGRSGRENKHLLHALAAKIILQSYLDDPARR
jgi:putative Holliday junction resolvase